MVRVMLSEAEMLKKFDDGFNFPPLQIRLGRGDFLLPGDAGLDAILAVSVDDQTFEYAAEFRIDTTNARAGRALGLAQLLPGTAGDMARELRESLPNDTLMFEPDRALRYGARYLRKLLDRFDGVVPVALTAYNAGPGKVRADWRELLARGGWALYCELAANADTQDYVRRILGYRQAYRELAPAIAP